MKTSHAKIIKAVISILFIAFILIHVIPFPINRDLDAVEIKLDDPSYLETRTISIKGTYRFNFLTKDTFKGQISVPEYEITAKRMFTVVFTKDDDIGRGDTLVYRYDVGTDTEGRPNRDYYSFGRFISKALMYRPAILVYEKNKGGLGGWGTDRGYCIVASARNREEALEILEKHGIFPPEHYE